MCTRAHSFPSQRAQVTSNSISFDLNVISRAQFTIALYPLMTRQQLASKRMEILRTFSRNYQYPLRVSSYDPGNRAGSVTGTNSAVCSYGKFQPGRPTKMMEHKFVLFATFKAFWTLVTLLIKLIRILLKWKYLQDQNYATLLAAMLWERSYFV